MDPNKTRVLIDEALVQGDVSAAKVHREFISDWIRRGGFPPRSWATLADCTHDHLLAWIANTVHVEYRGKVYGDILELLDVTPELVDSLSWTEIRTRSEGKVCTGPVVCLDCDQQHGSCEAIQEDLEEANPEEELRCASCDSSNVSRTTVTVPVQIDAWPEVDVEHRIESCQDCQEEFYQAGALDETMYQAARILLRDLHDNSRYLTCAQCKGQVDLASDNWCELNDGRGVVCSQECWEAFVATLDQRPFPVAVVSISSVTPFEEWAQQDQEELEMRNYEYEGCSTLEEALDLFHDSVAIKCLDDFNIVAYWAPKSQDKSVVRT